MRHIEGLHPGWAVTLKALKYFANQSQSQISTITKTKYNKLKIIYNQFKAIDHSMVTKVFFQFEKKHHKCLS